MFSFFYSIFLFFTLTNAQIPEGFESYSRRPHVSTVQPMAHTSLGTEWEKLKQSHLEAVAQLLEVYNNKNQHLYFLARDSELLYDFAVTLAQSDPELLSRLHLLNVNRANMSDKNLKPYLAQEGISEETLKNGKKIVFIDTGFSGTIPRTIKEQFTSQAANNMSTHLMCSSNAHHPSTRVFLYPLNPAAAITDPESMHSTIISYELMPRATDRASTFVNIDGTWTPISPKNKNTDGIVSYDKALQYQQDLKKFALEKKDEFENRRRLWRELLKETKENAVAKLKLLMAQNPTDHFWEAMARDFSELSELGRTNDKISLSDLGLQEIKQIKRSNKNVIILKFPQWKTFLEDPQTHLPKLIQAGEWGTLSGIIDQVLDHEIYKIIFSTLGYFPIDETSKSFIKALIEKGDTKVMPYMAEYIFSQSQTSNMNELIKLLIEKGDPKTLQTLAHYTFSKPHTQGMQELIKLVIEKGDPKTLQTLAEYTFSKPHTQGMQELIKLVIEKGDSETLQNLGMFVFSRPHTQNMTKLIKEVIEKRNAKALEILARYTFSAPHTHDMTELIKLVIEQGDSLTLQNLAKYVFSQPHTQNMTELIKLLIEKGDEKTIEYLAQHTFSKPHTQNMHDLLKLLIEKGNENTMEILSKITFSEPHTENMSELIKLLIEKGDRQIMQNLAEHTFSRPHTENMSKLIKYLIEKGDRQTRQNLARYTFSAPHTQNMSELIKLLIEEGDPKTLRNLAEYTFSSPHTQNMTELIKLLIEEDDEQVLQNLAKYTFSEPHTKNMAELIELMIEKGDAKTLELLENAAIFKESPQGEEVKKLKEALSIADKKKRAEFLKQIPKKWGKMNNCITPLIEENMNKLQGLSD